MKPIMTLVLLLTAGSLPADRLNDVLTKMDTAAQSFVGMEAQISYSKFTKVVEDLSTDSGGIFFQRNGKNYKIKIDFRDPEPKEILIDSGKGKVWIYKPKIDQKEEYDLGKERDRIEQFLLLGFGGGGHSLQTSYDVTLAGEEKGSVKLDLVPKGSASKDLKNVELWISTGTWQPVRQKFNQPGKDYLEVIYSEVKNGKLADSRLDLKTTGKTKTVRPGR